MSLPFASQILREGYGLRAASTKDFVRSRHWRSAGRTASGLGRYSQCQRATELEIRAKFRLEQNKNIFATVVEKLGRADRQSFPRNDTAQPELPTRAVGVEVADEE